MHQHRRCAGEHIVRVQVGDSEIVDALPVSGPVFGGGYLDVGAGAGAEPHARLEVTGVGPLVEVASDPEGVGVGGDDDAPLGTQRAGAVVTTVTNYALGGDPNTLPVDMWSA